MPIDLQKTQYISSLSGFRRKFTYNVTNPLPGYSLPTGTFVAIQTDLTFTNPGAVLGDISSIQIKYDGLETFWRHLDGFVFSQYPNFVSPDYEITALTFFTPTQHSLYIYIVNQTAGTVNVPAFTLRYKLTTYDTPFE